MSEREVAVVVGAGPGLGAALGRVFAGDGILVALASRNLSHVQPIADAIEGATAYGCDAASADAVTALFDRVGEKLGPPDIVVFNAGTFVRKGILETEAAEFERCWRIGCLGGFFVGQAAARLMTERGRGTIIFTGATASLRGGALFQNLAVPKFGLRALAQSMARELGPQGVHVGHVVIDGQILSERSGGLAEDRPPDALLRPDAIAAAYLQLHRQQRSAWTHELDLRPWVERF